MPNIRCQHCNTEIYLVNISKSLSDYGFINLTSEEEEIVAFYCPEDGCGKQMFVRGEKIGFSERIFDMCLGGQAGVRYSEEGFQYYAPFPFAKQNRSFMNSLGVYKIKRFDKNTINTYDFQVFQKDKFVSFNSNYLSILGDNYQIYWYPKESVEALLGFEDETGCRVFPRYIIKSSIINEIDMFCSDIPLRNTFIEDKELETIYKMLRESRNKVIVSRMFNFLNLLTPQSSLGNVNDSTLEAFRKSDYIWKKFSHNLLADNIYYKIDSFLTEYLNLYSWKHFSESSVCGLIVKFRNDIYKSLSAKINEEDEVRRTVADLTEMIRIKTSAFTSFITEDLKILNFEWNVIGLVKMKKPPNILITGETGSGKGQLAEAIHNASGRSGRFVYVNVPAIAGSVFESEMFGHKRGAFTGAALDRVGKFAEANEGTLFLDEIGNVPLCEQVKLLDVIQRRKVTTVGSNAVIDIDVLYIFATNKDLAELIESEKFREDLYHRITGLEFEIPPLRDRKGDIPLLVHHFAKKFARDENLHYLAEIRLSDEGAAHLNKLKLSGNVREIERLVARILSNRLSRGMRDTVQISVEEIQKFHSPLKTKSKVVAEVDLGQPGGFENDIKTAKARLGMRDQKTVEDVLVELYANVKNGNPRGIIKQAAASLGVTPEHFSRVARKWRLVYPWKR